MDKFVQYRDYALHGSPKVGPEAFTIMPWLNFSQLPEDDLRTIDWKILARTDKYHVKLFEDETNLRAHILLDCSRSMDYTSDKNKYPTKLAYGSLLAAALAHLMLRQNDAVGLVLFDSDYAWRVDRDDLWSKTKNSPFDERPVQGLVMATIVGGRTIYRHDNFTPAAAAA